MKTIQQIEEKMEKEHHMAIRLLSTTELERNCLISAMTSAYLSGHADATAECLTPAHSR